MGCNNFSTASVLGINKNILKLYILERQEKQTDNHGNVSLVSREVHPFLHSQK